MYNEVVEQNAHMPLSSETSHVSPQDELQLDTTRYTLTVDEAAQIFAEAGVPRSPRTITRFCQLGDLDCIRVDTEKHFKWLVDRNSAEKRIKELQQALRFTSKSQRDISSYVQPAGEIKPDITSHVEHPDDTARSNEEEQYLLERVEELENEIIHLKIDKQAKEHVINQMNSERRDFIAQMQDMSFKLGEAAAKLQLLEAPRPDMQPRQDARRVETEPREAEELRGEPAPLAETPAAEQTPGAPELKQQERGFFGRIFRR
jgi:ATP-dependent Lon protease